MNLSAGIDTYIPRLPLDTVRPNARVVILDRINARREILQEGAKEILELSSDTDKVLMLNRLYVEQSTVDLETAKTFPERSEERIELAFLAVCDAVKGMSLAGPYAIEEFRQNGSVIPPLPTPNPMRPPA